jgi:uncharacterized membrane protein YfcA
MNFIKKNYIPVGIGALAGAVNGLLGAGGGIIITYYLAHALNEEQKSENGVFANAVATMLPISVVSLVLYLLRGYIKVDNGLLSLFPSAIIGGVIGAFLLTKLKLKTVKLIFAFLVTLSGLFMIFK